MASEQYTKKMLDGWYCRSIANMQANEASTASAPPNLPPPPPPPPPAPPRAVEIEVQRPREPRKDYSSDSSSESEPEPNYRAQYKGLKRKLKYLIYENECFQDALRSSQKRLLKVSRDRSFLLDRLLQYEKGESTTSDSDDTESSDDTDYQRSDLKRKKLDSSQNMSTPSSMNKGGPAKRRRNVAPKKPPNVGHSGNERILQAMLAASAPSLGFGLPASDGHMTPEEVERHLQSRQTYLELLPERAPPTVPTEMFSNDPSLDSESNDVLENSPNVDEWFD